MAIERLTSGASLIDVLDRVLDKGIVVNPWIDVSLVGISVKIEPRVVVTSVPKSAPEKDSPTPHTFGSAASSRSAQLEDVGDAEQDD